MKKLVLVISPLLFLVLNLNAQTVPVKSIGDLFKDAPFDFYSIKEKGDAYIEQHPEVMEDESGEGMDYLRFKTMFDSRTCATNAPAGRFDYSTRAMRYYIDNMMNTCQNSSTLPSSWKQTGPIVTEPAKQGMGVILSLWVNPQDENEILAGSFCGGLFKTTDGGGHWHSITDNGWWPNSGISFIAVNPTDYNDIWVSTGMNRLSFAIWNVSLYGMGLLHSTDGGQNWIWDHQFYDDVLIVNNVSSLVPATDMLQFSPDGTKLFASASHKFFYKNITSNGNWTEINIPGFNQSFNAIKDMAFDNNNSSIVYITGAGVGIKVWKSTDGGLSYSANPFFTPSFPSAFNVASLMSLTSSSTFPNLPSTPSAAILYNSGIASGQTGAYKYDNYMGQDAIEIEPVSGNNQFMVWKPYANSVGFPVTHFFIPGQKLHLKFNYNIPQHVEMRIFFSNSLSGLPTAQAADDGNAGLPSLSYSSGDQLLDEIITIPYTDNGGYNIYNYLIIETSLPSGQTTNGSLHLWNFSFVPGAAQNMSIEVAGNNAIYIKYTAVYDDQQFIYKYTTSLVSENAISTFPCRPFSDFKATNTDDVLYLTGEQCLKSIDGGINFNIITGYGYADGVGGNIHADIRTICTFNGNANKVFVGTDGGVGKTMDGGTTWNNINGSGLIVTMFYGIGVSESEKDFEIGGAQDNGFYSSLPTWRSLQHGDGYDCALNTNDGDSYFAMGGGFGPPDFYGKSGANGTFGSSFLTQPPSTFKKQLDNPVYVEPVSDKVFWGMNNLGLYDKATNSWTEFDIQDPINTVDPAPGTYSAIANFDINKGDPSVWYVAYDGADASTGISHNKFFKRIPTGFQPPNDFSWKDYSNGLNAWLELTDVVSDPRNANKVWVSYGGYPVDGWNTSNFTLDPGVARVYYRDLGNSQTTWVDISKGLPPFPVNTLAYIEGSDDVVLAGTDVGVYVWNKNYDNGNNSYGKWECFNEGLPVVLISELQVNYCTGTLYAGTWGRGMWETSIEPLINSSPGGSTQIATSSTWTGDVRMTTDVEIEGGATLTILNADVNISPKRKISIKRGGRLIIDNSTLTNKCDEQWQGIYVFGNPSVAQSSYGAAHATTYPPTGADPNLYSGVLIVKNNSVIEHTNGVAVNNCEGDYNWSWGYNMNNSGGLIYADNSTFQDNFKDAAFMQYGYTEHSKFNECDFIANEYTPDHNLGTKEFVSMWDVHGTTYTACNFRNNTSTPRYYKGIFSIDADYTVTGKCLDAGLHQICDPCNSIERSEFTNLNYGIYSLGTIPEYPFNPIRITTSTFDGNKRGIFFSGINRSVVKDNDFVIPAQIFGAKPYGLYIEACKEFTVEENNFSSVAGIKNAGAYFADCNLQSNTVYRNNFNKLSTGIGAIGENFIRSYIGQDGGLFFKCNTFTDCVKEDIGVFTINPVDGYSYVSGGIPDQGHCEYYSNGSYVKEPAGNVFSDNVQWHLYKSNDAYPFTYFYQPDAAHTPNNYSQDIYPDDCFGYLTFSCPPTSCWKEHKLAKILERKSEYVTLTKLIDGGSKELLMQKIKDPNTSSEALKMYLIAAGPYLTDSIIMATINRSYPLVAQDLAVVVLSNSPIEDTVFLRLMQSRPAVASDIQVLLGQLPPKSARDILAKEMLALNAEKELLIKESINHFIQNETTDSLPDFFDAIGEPERGIEYYLSQKNYSEVENLISGNTSGDKYIAESNEFLSMILPYLSDSILNDTLSAADVEQIRTWSADMNSISFNARNWLEFNKGEESPEYIPEEDSVTERMEMKNSLLPNFIAEVYPNPSGDYIWMKLKESDNEIIPTLTDMSGRIVNKDFNLLSTGYFKLDVTDLADGIYFIEWRNNNGLLVDRNKITVIH